MLKISKIPATLYHRTLRKLMPSVNAFSSGVRSHQTRKMFDITLLPDRFSYPRDRPYYETALVFGLRNYVKKGDRVTIIGGGFGITSVIASNLAGCTGRVTVYEGSIKQVAICNLVVSMNEPLAPVDIRHAIIGDDIGVYGIENGNTLHLAPFDLEDCDVLEMDCEGSELSILRTMEIRPRVILVETHGFLGSKTEDVKSELERINYTVLDFGFAEVDKMDECLKNDIRVLAALKNA